MYRNKRFRNTRHPTRRTSLVDIEKVAENVKRYFALLSARDRAVRIQRQRPSEGGTDWRDRVEEDLKNRRVEKKKQRRGVRDWRLSSSRPRLLVLALNWFLD